MVSHTVLFRLRRDLTRPDREALVRAFEVAVRDIPSVRSCRVGRRVTFGAGYEAGAPDLQFAVVIDFDDLDGLQAYLRHPAHVDVGARFNASIDLGLVFDYRMSDPTEAARWIDEPGAI
jgi:hypothetical protein